MLPLTTSRICAVFCSMTSARPSGRKANPTGWLKPETTSVSEKSSGTMTAPNRPVDAPQNSAMQQMSENEWSRRLAGPLNPDL